MIEVPHTTRCCKEAAVDEPIIASHAYARWRATELGKITERVEKDVVFGLHGSLRGKRVLDVGTGDGTYAIEAAARGAVVTALDPSSDMLDAARARAEAQGVNVTFIRARVEKLPLPNAAFDAILAVTVLCFVKDDSAAAREMARVLAPGGRLVLGELGRYSLWAAERRVRGLLGAPTWRRARFWSRGELAAVARDAALEVVDVRGAVFYPPSSTAARLAAPLERVLTRLRAPGAAFLAVAADKPGLRSRRA